MAGYGDDTGLQAWLDSQGLTLPAAAPTAAVLRQIGSDYLDAAYEAKLQCSVRAGGFDQERSWPRSGHRVGGRSIPDDLIPVAWVNASYRAAWLEASTAGWATGSANPNRITKREKVSDIEREFFAASETAQADVAAGMPADGMINGMVQPWLCSKARSLDNLFRVI